MFNDRAWYIQSVRLDIYRRIMHGTENLKTHKVNASVPFFADSWYGKNELEWTVYPVGR